MLEIADLDVFYDEAQALSGVSLAVGEHEIVALVGPNGAGKTTLASAVAGLIPSRAGSIVVEGAQIAGLPSWKVAAYGVAIVPEGRRLFPHMSVGDNLELGAYRSAAWSRRRETTGEVFELFPILYERRRQMAGDLSGGQQQMLAIGRALMARPRLLVLDEPSLGIAPALVDDIFGTLLEIRERGVAVLLIEQNVTRALELAEHGYFLNEGSVALEGDASVLLGNDELRRACLGTV